MDLFTKQHLTKWLESNIPSHFVDSAYSQMSAYVENNDIVFNNLNWFEIADKCDIWAQI